MYSYIYMNIDRYINIERGIIRTISSDSQFLCFFFRFQPRRTAGHKKTLTVPEG